MKLFMIRITSKFCFRITYICFFVSVFVLSMSAQPVHIGKIQDIAAAINCGKDSYESKSTNEWQISLPLSDFKRVDSLSGKGNYYSIITQENNQVILRAEYIPPENPVRLGYQFSDTMLDVSEMSWTWRVLKPPFQGDESRRKNNDCGAGIYLVFKSKMQIFVIKYVYSTTVSPGTVIRRDPLYPLQRLCIVVANKWNEDDMNEWKQVNVNVRDDFKRLFNAKECPPLRGIGIMSDGDNTKDKVVAEYKQFVLMGVKN